MNSPSDWPGVAAMIRRVTTGKGRNASGLFAIEGTRLIERAVRAGAALETVLIGETFNAATDNRTQDLLAAVTAAGAVVVVAPDSVVADLTGGRDLGAIVGLVRRPPPLAPADLMASSGGPPGLFLAGIDIMDPGNAGALVRTAHAAGATAFLAVGTTDPFHPRATRISRGSILRLPVAAFASADELVVALQRLGVRTVATAATGGTLLPNLGPMPGPTAVLMGNEGSGLPESVQQAVDLVVTIPMPTGVDSFAVNAAAAIVLYEFGRLGVPPVRPDSTHPQP